ncbi:MAG: hypothetical protein ACOCUL_04740, partial [Bacteroidota bacterium]
QKQSVKKYTKLETVAKDESHTFKVSLRQENNIRYLVAIYTGDLGCMNKESTILIKLLNNEVVKLLNTGEEGCAAGETLMFELDYKTMKKLKSSPFSRIRVTGSDFFADLEPLLPNFFTNKIRCIE